MDRSLFPTKGNYILAKKRLALSRQGYELLDKKRNILIREIMSMLDQAEELQKSIDITFSQAYQALQTASFFTGINTVEEISKAVEEEDEINIGFKSIMGVEIPIVAKNKTGIKPEFGFSNTEQSLDQAYLKFVKAKNLTIELAEIENAIYRLAVNIKKTQKRANALKNVMIPKYEKIIYTISAALEEKEREEFSTLKLIKSKKTK